MTDKGRVIKLQVPMDPTVYLQVKKMTEEYGYSSVQEVVRVLLASVASGDLRPGFVPGTYMDPAAQVRHARKLDT